jgi:hypothetical protein
MISTIICQVKKNKKNNKNSREFFFYLLNKFFLIYLYEFNCKKLQVFKSNYFYYFLIKLTYTHS